MLRYRVVKLSISETLTSPSTELNASTARRARIAADVALSINFDFIEKCNGSLGRPPTNKNATVFSAVYQGEWVDGNPISGRPWMDQGLVDGHLLHG